MKKLFIIQIITIFLFIGNAFGATISGDRGWAASSKSLEKYINELLGYEFEPVPPTATGVEFKGIKIQ